MKLKLDYGTTGLVAEFPDHATVIEPVYVPPVSNALATLTDAIRYPIGWRACAPESGMGRERFQDHDGIRGAALLCRIQRRPEDGRTGFGGARDGDDASQCRTHRTSESNLGHH